MPDQVPESVEGSARRLAAEVHELSALIVKMRRSDRRRWITTAAVILGMIATGTAAAVDARAQDREQSQRWCALLDTITTPLPSGVPQTPTTKRQRDVIAQLTKLSEDFDCPHR